MSVIDLASVSNESLATELYRRVAPKSPLLVIGSNITQIQYLLSTASKTSNAPMITDSGVFIVVNTDQTYPNSTPLRPLNPEIVEGTGHLGKFIEIQTSNRGLRQVPRIRKSIKHTLQQHPMVANIGLDPGPRYRIAIDVYTQEPEIHQQIARSVDGTMEDFVFQFYPRRRSKMTLENRQAVCSGKHGPHNPDGTVSFRIHYPVQNGSAFRYASNYHVFATNLGSNIGHGDLRRLSRQHFEFEDVRMALPCLGTSQCRYVHRFDKGEYTEENDIAFTEEILDSEIEYREESKCSIEDVDAILYLGRLGNIKDPELFEIQIKTHRGVVTGTYTGIYNYTENLSGSDESASDGSVSDGSNKSDSAIRSRLSPPPTGGPTRSSSSSSGLTPHGGSDDSQSSIRGDRLEFVDQIRTRLHAGLSTESGDSGSPVYLVDKRSHRQYLIGVHRSRHQEDAYAVPMGVILEYAAHNLDLGVGGHDATYTWRLTSVDDHN